MCTPKPILPDPPEDRVDRCFFQKPQLRQHQKYGNYKVKVEEDIGYVDVIRDLRASPRHDRRKNTENKDEECVEPRQYCEGLVDFLHDVTLIIFPEMFGRNLQKELRIPWQSRKCEHKNN